PIGVLQLHEFSFRWSKDSDFPIVNRKSSIANFLSFLPRTKKPSQHDYLSQMIRVVIGNQQCFSQDCLAVTPGDGCIEVGLGFANQILHRLEVFSERLDAVVPSGRT